MPGALLDLITRHRGKDGELLDQAARERFAQKTMIDINQALSVVKALDELLQADPVDRDPNGLISLTRDMGAPVGELTVFFDKATVSPVRAVLRGLPSHDEDDEYRCAGCGCTDNNACERGCYWLETDADSKTGICSNCEEHLRDWKIQHGLPVHGNIDN